MNRFRCAQIVDHRRHFGKLDNAKICRSALLLYRDGPNVIGGLIGKFCLESVLLSVFVCFEIFVLCSFFAVSIYVWLSKILKLRRKNLVVFKLVF